MRILSLDRSMHPNLRSKHSSSNVEIAVCSLLFSFCQPLADSHPTQLSFCLPYSWKPTIMQICMFFASVALLSLLLNDSFLLLTSALG